MSRGRKRDAKLGAIDLFVVDCDQSTIKVESGDMITIHPVLQYYDVIARDLPLISVIVRKICGLQESWRISRANTFTGIGSKSQQFSSNFGVDHNFGAILNIGSGAWPSVGHRTKAGFHDCDAVVQSGPI